MHVPDGILPLAMTLGGWACSAGLVAISLKRIEALPDPRAGIPRAALLTAVYFAGSLIHIPVPPASVHLMLNGLMGVMLGWYAVPAILIGLFFQAVMFGHGGLTTLGVNGVIFALPALAAFGLMRMFGAHQGRIVSAIVAFASGAGAVIGALALFAGILLAGLPAYLDAATERAAMVTLAIAHIPLIVVEGLVVAAVLQFLRRVSPGLLDAA